MVAAKADPLTVKLYYEEAEELHRLRIESPDTFSYKQLLGELTTLFPSLEPKISDYFLHYVDDEGDDIILSRDSDVSEALRLQNLGHILRIRVSKKKQSKKLVPKEVAAPVVDSEYKVKKRYRAAFFNSTIGKKRRLDRALNHFPTGNDFSTKGGSGNTRKQRRCAYCGRNCSKHCPTCDANLCTIIRSNEKTSCFEKFHTEDTICKRVKGSLKSKVRVDNL